MGWFTRCTVFLIFFWSLRDAAAKNEFYSNLLAKHDPLAPPGYNVTVGVKFHLSQIHDVDEIKQIISTSAVLEVHWDDPTLKWNSDATSHLKYVTLPSTSIWTPTLWLANSATKQEALTGHDVLVYSDGHVEWSIPTYLTSSCTIDVTYYPFDQQTCIFKLVAADRSMKLELQDHKSYMLLDQLYLSVSWDVIEVPAYLNVYVEKDGQQHTDITWYLTMRRKTLWLTQVWPAVTFALLTLLPSLLPRSKFLEKLLLNMFSLGGVLIIWRDAGERLPSTMVMPLLYKYLMALAILNILQLIATCILSHWSNSSTASLWDNIYRCFRRRSRELEQRGGLEENFTLTPKNVVDISTNSIWLTLVKLFVVVVVVTGVVVTTCQFLLDHPHVGENVDAFKIAKMYT